MRVDQPDPEDEPDNVGMAGNDRPSDRPDVASNDLEKEESSEGLPGLSPALHDTVLRIERTLAHRAKVEAVYRQYDLEQGNGTIKDPKRETATFAMRRVEAGDPHRHLTGHGSRPAEEARLAEAADGNPSPAKGGSSLGDHRGTSRDPAILDNGGREFHENVASDAASVHEDGLDCPVSELKGDEPRTAERLMKSPDFTGKNLRGFKDTDNPDFIDDYKRTYDAVAGPTAWASPRLNMDRMLNQIQRHIYEKDGVDFTVLDLTGASGAQIDEVFKSLDKWASNPEMHPKSKLIILGGGY